SFFFALNFSLVVGTFSCLISPDILSSFSNNLSPLSLPDLTYFGNAPRSFCLHQSNHHAYPSG
ncbi:MAG: hypothetical protein AAF639_43205, partial [Chloroflexota bacterium]